MAALSKVQMSKLFYRLEKTHSAGIDILTAIRREGTTGSPSFRNAMNAIADRVQKGQSLAEAFHSLGDVFPPLVVAVVTAGERGGRLEESFGRLHHHFESLVQFRRRLLQGMAWPVFELCMSVVVCGALILILGFVMDSGGMPPIDWLGLGLSTTQFFVLYCVTVFLFFSTLFFLVFGSMKGWFGTWPMRLARYVPLVGKTIECLSLSRFAWTLSVAENAGMRPQETAQLALASTQNFFFTRLSEPVTQNLDRREEFHQALASTDSFPADFLIQVQNGEMTGELAEVMDRASKNLQETAENNLKIISTVGFVLTFLFVAAIIGGTVIYLYQKIYIDQINNLSNGRF